MKKILSLLCFITTIIISCGKPETPPAHPLTDLSWLKEKIDEINFLVRETKMSPVAIYQCTDEHGKTVFMEDHHYIAYFYNCNGEIVCITGAFVDEICPEFNIVSKELIWETNPTTETENDSEISSMEYSLEGTSFLWINLKSVQ